jgi:hypothetical protein
MAKKKVTPSRGDRKSIMTLKGSVAWADWLNRFSEFSRMPVTTLIDVSLADRAQQQGFEAPPKR